MNRLSFEAFSVVLPRGWSDVIEEETYSDPGQLPPVAFASDADVGRLYVSIVPIHADDHPGVSPDDALAWALDWGRRRGVAPIEQLRDSSPRGGLGYAAFELSGSFVAVWYLFAGAAVIHASYVCPAGDQAIDREAREAIVASLAFSGYPARLD